MSTIMKHAVEATRSGRVTVHGRAARKNTLGRANRQDDMSLFIPLVAAVLQLAARWCRVAVSVVSVMDAAM
jgi:hypothetical protein